MCLSLSKSVMGRKPVQVRILSPLLEECQRGLSGHPAKVERVTPPRVRIPPLPRFAYGKMLSMVWLLWILAVVLVCMGVWRIMVGDLILGIVLIVVGLLVGPGGVSIFT